MARSDTQNSPGSGRVYIFDEIRGFAILCMVVYHAMYQLQYIFMVDVPIFFSDWFGIIRNFFAGTFIFISGIMCRYSRNNLKRGVQCFFLGMILTFIAPFVTEGGIYFGILHFMGIAMMIYGLFGELLEKVPSLVGIIVCVVLAIMTWNIYEGYIGIPNLFEWSLPNKAREVGILFPFGIINDSFATLDFFPLFPWLFVFIAGSYFGLYSKNGSLPKTFYRSHIKWLGNVGRYTIWIYMLHIPVIYLIFSLIFR